jgi:hypothetical protein
LNRVRLIKAGIVSAIAGAVLIGGVLVVGGTVANAQTPDPSTPAPQQTQPANPDQNGGSSQDDGMQRPHDKGDCPGMGVDSSGGSSSSSPSSTFRGGPRGQGNGIVYRQ